MMIPPAVRLMYIHSLKFEYTLFPFWGIMAEWMDGWMDGDGWVSEAIYALYLSITNTCCWLAQAYVYIDSFIKDHSEDKLIIVPVFAVVEEEEEEDMLTPLVSLSIFGIVLGSFKISEITRQVLQYRDAGNDARSLARLFVHCCSERMYALLRYLSVLVPQLPEHWLRNGRLSRVTQAVLTYF